MEILQNLHAQLVFAYRAHHTAVQSELRYVIRKVCRRTAYFLSFGQHVPQCFAHSYYDCIVHGF